jgi:hypothetical protein
MMLLLITVTVAVLGTAKPGNPQESQRLMVYLEQHLHLPKRSRSSNTSTIEYEHSAGQKVCMQHTASFWLFLVHVATVVSH